MTTDRRFVVLRHSTPEGDAGLHWDFMLEVDGILRMWALPAEPVAGEAMIAARLPDHRLAYLDYEGPISGGRGEVVRWDCGAWEPLDASELVNDNELVARLRGERLIGRVTLTREPAAPQRWRFFFLSTLPASGSGGEPGST